MNSLGAFLCLLGLIALSHCDCFFEELVLKDLNNPPTACVDKDGGRHAFGSEWVKDCYECSCTQNGMSCCSIVPSLGMMEIPNGCELVVNKKGCSAKLVLKADKTKECPI
ncbi:hypothetical protein CRUP_018137 [Coryphaenoides rupestris]|nr:hypothetical protein CRUP_018137 [Coryphaenoides rupestris]